ncbi:Ribonuclease/ribotoxin [Phyllosticta capitalensis]
MATITYEPSACNCNGTDYSTAPINAAATKALALAKDKKTLGDDKYPHVYNDYEHFAFSHANAPYLEFPILPSGAVYDGGAPGADRVVIGSIAADYASAVFCACLTHDGSAKRNGFVECKDDTVNPRGKGTLKESAGERKLVERIDL